ncbi:helix-turn-helix domain-containing protein [Vibrio sonorensis]|uniref:helix-turn-helix domain-containing protein n=1 Tax=Vibrio sonorensis TaxID=1004316 RepID=UPI0008DA0236|nr:helix-turn-helix domain-containing protein [Vibrio sonorensis]
MYRTFWVWLALFFSQLTWAMDDSPKVFYPLPTQSQGKVFAAKNLFLASEGGLWIQDVRNQVLLFDGTKVLPSAGSLLPNDHTEVVYLQEAFWSFIDNEIYRTLPNRERELILSLKPGTEIRKIGTSGDYVWVSDDANFYTYHALTGQFDSYSLMELYKFNQSTDFKINDAAFILSKWVLATNAGVYLSDENGFSHVEVSGNRYVERLYFSERRRELLIGALDKVLIFNVEAPGQPVTLFATSHVLSITETGQDYWIGTEDGLYFYSFMTGEFRRFDDVLVGGNSLSGEKIYALLNDERGGVWIATDKGIRYYSLFSENFVRVPLHNLTGVMRSDKPEKLIPRESQEGYWMITKSGLFIVDRYYQRKDLVYKGRVNDVLESDGYLYIAVTGKVLRIKLSLVGHRFETIGRNRQGNSAEFLEAGSNGVIWGIGRDKLWRYEPKENAAKLIGSDWMLDQYLPAKVTRTALTEDDILVIGTEHGTYIVKGDLVRFVDDSTQFGKVFSILPISDDEVWVAAAYGSYRLSTKSSYVYTLPMVDAHIKPQCMLMDDNGVWLTSSAGLTHYQLSGSIENHFGYPYGLINNEFLSGMCSNGSSAKPSIVLGSKHGLVLADTSQLISSYLPQPKLVFSHIKANQQLVSLAGSHRGVLNFNFGDSISVQVGVLPSLDNMSLEYKLDREESWQALEGNLLTIDHALPGKYQLIVRFVENGKQVGMKKSLFFSVLEPWYLRSYAVVAYICTAVLLVLIFATWRSRLVVKSNRKLKAQVALKTNQLRHQSRILLANNNQLRKQIQVRHILFTQSVQSLLDKISSKGGSDGEINQWLSGELSMLLNIRSDSGRGEPVYNLCLVVQSVIDGWQEELTKAEMSVDFDCHNDQEHYVLLESFNLDGIFNWLFDSAVKRGFKNQILTIRVARRGDNVVCSMFDLGEKPTQFIDDENPMYQELVNMVEQSGGQLHCHTSDERNLVELSWPARNAFNESTVTEPENHDNPKSEEDPWLDKLSSLVNQHYSDSEFGTSSAAKMLYVSERSLQRRVKTLLNKTFKEYLSEVRLDHACRKLLAGEKVADVAFDCGFNDPSYFSQRFKHRFGVSPTQFVEQSDNDDSE